MTDNIQYGTTKIDYTVEYAERKTLGIKVHPDKSVQVIAPLDTKEEEVKKKVKGKAAWILKQQDFFLSFYPITPARKYVSGETHLYLGKQYRLKLFESKNESVKLHGGNIEVSVNSKAEKDRIEKLLKEWYRNKAETHFNQLFKASVPLSNSFYKGMPQIKFRWMQKRWGSCNKNGLIMLNTELIKTPKRCIEYVIIHELCHLAHLNHSAAFYNLLEKLYPGWRKIKHSLEKLMV